MLRFFSAVDKVIARGSDILVLATSLIVVGMVFFQVIARYVFKWSIIGLDEIALISAIWLYMVGAIVASRRAEHLVVDFLPQNIHSPFFLRVHQIAVALIMIGASTFFIYLAWQMMSFAVRRPQSTAGLGIPELIPLGAVFLASVLSFAYALRDLITGKACHNPTEAGGR